MANSISDTKCRACMLDGLGWFVPLMELDPDRHRLVCPLCNYTEPLPEVRDAVR